LSKVVSKIQADRWSHIQFTFESHKNLIEGIEQLIIAKEFYFAIENDLFTIEFKWFQYYNVLSADEKLIINQLMDKDNWRKTFLIFYLNSILVNSASFDLPTNDLD